MKPDIKSRLQKDFGEDFLTIVKVINQWDVETKSLLDDRLLRVTIYLVKGKKEEFERIKEIARLDFRDVLWQAEYDGGEERIRDFNRQFGSEETPPITQ